MTLTPLISQAQSVTDLLARLREKYTTSALEVHFREHLSTASASDTVTYTGVMFLKGNAFRIETPLQVLVTDGSTIWVYHVPDSQVVIDTYREDLFSFSPDKLIHLPLDIFTITDSTYVHMNHRRLWRITLRPREPGTLIDTLILWLDPEGPQLVQAAIKDANGTWMRFEITRIQLHPDLPDTLFQFSPPPDVEVVDLRL